MSLGPMEPVPADNAPYSNLLLKEPISIFIRSYLDLSYRWLEMEQGSLLERVREKDGGEGREG